MYKDLNTSDIESKLSSIGHGAGRRFLDSFLDDNLSATLSSVTDIGTLFERLNGSSHRMLKLAQLANNESDIRKLVEVLQLIKNKQSRTAMEQPFKTLYDRRSTLTKGLDDQTMMLVSQQWKNSDVFRKFKEKLFSPLKISKLEAFTVLLFLFIFTSQQIAKFKKEIPVEQWRHVLLPDDFALQHKIMVRSEKGSREIQAESRRIKKFVEEESKIDMKDTSSEGPILPLTSGNANYVDSKKYRKMYEENSGITNQINRILYTWFAIDVEYPSAGFLELLGFYRSDELKTRLQSAFNETDFDKTPLKLVEYNQVETLQKTITQNKEVTRYLTKLHEKLMTDETNIIVKPKVSLKVKGVDGKVKIFEITLNMSITSVDSPMVISEGTEMELPRNAKMLKQYRGISGDEFNKLIIRFKDLADNGFASSISESETGARLGGQGVYWTKDKDMAKSYANRGKYGMIITALYTGPGTKKSAFIRGAIAIQNTNDNYLIIKKVIVVKDDEEGNLKKALKTEGIPFIDEPDKDWSVFA